MTEKIDPPVAGDVVTLLGETEYRICTIINVAPDGSRFAFVPWAPPDTGLTPFPLFEQLWLKYAVFMPDGQFRDHDTGYPVIIRQKVSFTPAPDESTAYLLKVCAWLYKTSWPAMTYMLRSGVASGAKEFRARLVKELNQPGADAASLTAKLLMLERALAFFNLPYDSPVKRALK